MGLERLEFGVRVRKLMLVSVKTCYRSVWNHPFLVGLVCFLIFLYRTFPLLFSVLVTASPVLVCTAFLLGTLLSFGSPNIPEIDEREEEKVSHEVSSLKTTVTADDTVIEKDVGDDDFVVERHVGKRWDKVESADEKVSLVNNEASDIEEDDGLVHYKPLIGKDLDSRDIHCENGVIDGAEETLNDSLVEKKREIQEEMLGSEGVLRMREAAEDHLLADELAERNLEVEAAKLTADFSDVLRGDELDASLLSSWKRVGDDEDVDDDESLDSGSDGAESSSPDASMADIIPMLDELHPLLGLEAPQPAQMSHDDSDAASDRSHGISSDSESDELENQVEEDNDDDDEEDEGEGAKEDKEDESKSAIKWTEADEKNLMDLGTSELERNQRLENLIARRRARKNMRLMAEKNLIDLDSADLPLNIASISTTRRNPFDLPYDSYDDLGLPPIPGSAPSILQPRRNPFDLPYDSSEEKPDLKDDSFEEEFSGFNQRETVSQREAFFRRHESFNVGPSSLGVPRQELKWKPYFVPERLLAEGANPSSFQRQSSEVSESKLSSVPDTESVSSIVDDEDNKPNEQDVSQETELDLHGDHASVHDEQESQSSGDVEIVDVDKAENRDVHHDVVEITLGDGESQLEMGSSLSEAGVTSHRELNSSEIHPTTEPVEDDYSSRSSLSSLSEIDEKISDVKEGSAAFESTDHDSKEPDISTQPSSEDSAFPDVKGEGSAALEPTDHESKEPGISTQPSFEESEFHFTSRLVDDGQHKEPVYDSSPSSVHKILSFSSVSSDTQAEISEMGSPSMLVESTDKKSKGHGEPTEQGTSTFQEMYAGSTNSLNEPKERALPEINEHDVTHADSLGVSSTSVDHNVSMVSVAVAEAEHVSMDAGRSSSDEGMVDDVPNKEESFNQNEVDLSSLAAETTIGVDQGMSEVLGSSPEELQHPLCLNESSDAEPVGRPAVYKEDTQLEQDEIHSSSSSEDNLVEGMVVPEEEITQTEWDQMHPSNDDASLDVGGQHDAGEELSSTALSYRHMPSNDASSSLTEESSDAVVSQISQIHPSEADTEQEHKMESKLEQDQSSCSDSKIDTGLHRDKDLEEIHSDSSYEDVSSRENSLPESEKQLSASDGSLDELPIDDNDKLREPSIIATERTVEVNIVDTDVNIPKVHDSEDKLSTNFSSMTSESTSLPAESSEHMLPTDQDDLKFKILNKIESEDPKEVSEHFNYAAEVYATHADGENISEEVDEIKEIDEGILSELDSVGDFNVKEFGLPEGSHIGYTESAVLEEDSKTDSNVKLPVLEARSVEDIDLAFKQLHEGVEVEEVILPSMIENQRDPVDTNSRLPVVDARSLEDIQSALQQVPEPNPAELLHSSDLGNGSSEVEGDGVVSAKEIEVGNVVPDIQEISENAAGEPKNEHEEASEKSSLGTSDDKGKKAKSHDSSSSSSSSSSDSE